MAPHSNTLAWKIPWTEEPGRLQSMGSLRVGHDWVTSLSLFTFMHWRRKWQPTPAFLPGESQGQWSLVGCRLWGRTESDTTEAAYSSSSSVLPQAQQLIFDRGANGKGKSFWANSVETTRYLLSVWKKIMNLDPNLTPYTKMKLRWLVGQSVNVKL